MDLPNRGFAPSNPQPSSHLCPWCRDRTTLVADPDRPRTTWVSCDTHGRVGARIALEVPNARPYGRSHLCTIEGSQEITIELDLAAARAALHLVPDRGSDGDGWLSTTE